jgi:hypothetical protein
MTDIDSFLDALSDKLWSALNELDPSGQEITHWIVVDDAVGVDAAGVDDEPNAHEVLAGLIDGGAEAAAYATYNRAAGTMVVSVLVADPRNSDIRRASVSRAGERLIIGPWEYVL